MTQTIVGVFDSPSQAAIAAEALVQSGIDRAKIDSHLRGEEGNAGAAIDPAAKRAAADERSAGLASQTETSSEGPLGHLQSFFAKLLGMGHAKEQVSHYQEAVRRGGTLLIVELDRPEQAEATASLLRRTGAVDIDQRVDTWRASGYRG